MVVYYLILALLFLIYYVIFENRFSKKQRFLFKMINSFNFCMVAILSYLFNKDVDASIAIFLMVALGLGFFGDVFLGLQYVYPQVRHKLFILGFLVFLCGHIVYLIYFINKQLFFLFVPLIVIGIIGIIQLVTQKLKITFGKYQILVYVYLVVITFVWAPSLVGVIQNATTHRIIFFLGITFFFVSDLLLAVLYFKKIANPRFLKLINSTLYFLGQLLIAFSIYFIN